MKILEPKLEYRDVLHIPYLPKFALRQFVFYMKDNKVQRSRINCIHMPQVWVDTYNQIQMTSTKYNLNSGEKDIHECSLFDSKEKLLKSL